ncbi:diaminohydroxyphosphoribosylaminopyrimidine deaminase/5-amino-6-(5-phosphoribosylamino)uracil reductase [Aequitasia blattaphilus]|uniref:Riboflavin biosynthesis protein RibD n=1 Tax=Aequitasia blattaphilus TaxID=2949332 RepID=A0ABT1E545_9FIRM|nr:bifunctional diaminohydroxyphosphoribosylaminopyrimidine deaminase/5-amino-6-(5-phosphoribosylamino)uracil reductase RibD [Aequitasia blattaphilus]MCP1100966.1 bifunctional diaminohydroxyphosphoribosylaminopyrimidine deaminase/5-amino-6-(5-phosphoribosylamino)uracil reductase RibD [Aequitasia blattaphilus]MCR8613606.1 bifunctional diaminohydroxyphosphoribosylaminopyrimidine deaminase/5-amino-6-(5-phosphoribosylamino)uracil reductase RibD [Aequitasia blattaphilus]
MHKQYMNLAIEEAKKGIGNTYTNPLVGAVIVKDNRVIAKGAHLKYGCEHAERNAINHCQSPEELFDSTLYVTLEPCNHFGKQPPCSHLIVEKGIKRVIIGQLDPNPLVKGQGKAFLEDHGIQVIVGVNEEEVYHLNEYYNFLHRNKRPYIVLKQALTLDGRIAMNRNSPASITGQAVWDRVHKERGKYQGILVGSQTILSDNPTLLSLGSSLYPPVRIVLDRQGRILKARELNLFKNKLAPLWIFTESEEVIPDLPHVTVIRKETLTLNGVLTELAERSIHSLYVEGGGRIHDAFFAENLWDEIVTYISPKIIGGNSLPGFSSHREATGITPLHSVAFEQLGTDFRISGRRTDTLCLQD